MPTPSSEFYREIPLTQGQVAIVDAEDYDRLMQWKWYAAFRKGNYYAQRNEWIGSGRCRTVYLHRVVLEMTREDKLFVDHANMNTLDDRKFNLRPCTHSQNQANKKTKAACGMKGAYWKGDCNKWQAQIGINGRLRSLGLFLTAEEAHAAYRVAAIAQFGEFARFD